ncbi:hypothetical protein [Sphingomonas jaspsi]|uniref:hypothetical protein n=1 Tax=Sphingomonas jaspsi TaxID=392409 RepID=UPI0012EC88AD|nr:hypothetical protein [Sphingomonas jaspsi]
MSVLPFWKWLFRGGDNSPAGVRNIVNPSLLFHAVVGLIATTSINADPYEFAGKALFPAASILVGLSLAWTTRASTALQNRELREKLITDFRPAEDYVYGYQLAILSIICMVIYVCIMSAGGLNIRIFNNHWDGKLSGFWMYFIISISLRECWGVVNFTNMLTLLDYRR